METDIGLKSRTEKREIGLDFKMTWLALNRMYNAAAEKVGINTNIGFVLLHIDDELGTPATKIAPLMGMESRSLTRMLANMESMGLIRRAADPLDGRLVRIFPTEYGREVKAIAKQVVIAFSKEVYQSLPEEKLNTFFEVIDRINEIIKTQSLHDNSNSHD